MISHRQISFFNESLSDLYTPGLDLETYSQRAFSFLGRFLKTELIVLAARDAGSGVLTSTADRALPSFDWAVRVYAQFGPSQPFSSYDPSVNKGRPVSRSDFCSRRQYRNLPLYSELFRHYGFINRMVIPVLSQSGKSLFFSVSRSGDDFSSRDRILATLAQTHLATAHRLAEALSANKPWSISPDTIAMRGFSPRESEVLYWLTEGKSNVEIAAILHITLATVKGYITSIFNKTGTSNRLAATLHVIELVKPSPAWAPYDSANPYSFTVPFGVIPTKVG